MAQDKIQKTSAVTKQVNVTDLTPLQIHELFIEYLAQAGFSGFIKIRISGQTYYTFTYRD